VSCTGAECFRGHVFGGIRKTFQVGSEDTNVVLCVGQSARWEPQDNSPRGCLVVEQEKAVEETYDIEFGKRLKDGVVCTPALHTE